MFTFRHPNDSQSLDGRGAEGHSRATSRASRLGTHWLRRLGTGGSLLLLLSLFTLVSVGPALAAAGQVTEFLLPQSCAAPCGPAGLMVRGSDGNLWFSTQFPSGLGRITPTGQISEFLIPAFKGNRAQARQLTVGTDGNLWFTSTTLAGRGTPSNGFIGRITTAGVITQFGTPTAVSDPGAIAVGSDGNVWFTETTARAIGRITTH